VWARDFPDPFLTTVGSGDYVGYATSVGVVQVKEGWSGDLAQWVGPQEALRELPAWAVPYSSWAPALAEVDGSYLLYYTAMVAGTDRHCISVAEASTPSGPFVDRSTEPFLCPMELGGAIDPSPFVDAGGDRYLLWKSDGVTLRRESAIWSQALSDDGRRLVAPAVRLIATDQAWEYPHVEAPSMAAVDGTYWLVYSGNWWNSDAYGLGVARCDSPAGPCEKPNDGPVLASAPGRYGPGGGELFRDQWDRLLLAYHAWPEPPGFPGGRALFIATVRADAVDLAVDSGESGSAPVAGFVPRSHPGQVPRVTMSPRESFGVRRRPRAAPPPCSRTRRGPAGRRRRR
jgi:beta-xylosidase